MENALELKNLSYAYPDGTPALYNVNLNIRKQKKTAVVGTNGSGKTTLIYHINGTIPAQEGTVKVMEHLVCKENLINVRKSVGLLFDNPDNQLFSTTVYGDIAFGPRNLKMNQERLEKKVQEVMGKLKIKELAERPPYSLSLGQKKRAAIAGLFAMEPQVMACDEPFSGLDPAVSRQFRDLLDKMIENGTTLIYSTHDVDLAYAWADDVVIMKDGHVLSSGTADLLREKNIMEKASLPLPLLAELFKESEQKPRTIEEAVRLLED